MFWKVFLGVVLYLVIGYIGIKLGIKLNKTYEHKLSSRFDVCAVLHYENTAKVFTCKTEKSERVVVILGFLMWPITVLTCTVLRTIAYKKTYREYEIIEKVKKEREEKLKMIFKRMMESGFRVV